MKKQFGLGLFLCAFTLMMSGQSLFAFSLRFDSPSSVESVRAEPGHFLIQVSADEALSEVQFFINNQMIDDVNDAPFTATVMDLPAGKYSLMVKGVSVANHHTSKSMSLEVIAITGRVRQVNTSAGLQDALDTALSGDTILVAPGDYYGQFNVSRGGKDLAHPIVLQSAQRWRAILHPNQDKGNCGPVTRSKSQGGNGTTFIPSMCGNSKIINTLSGAQNIVIKGFTFQGRSGWWADAAINTQSGYVLEDNHFIGTAAGIAIKGDNAGGHYQEKNVVLTRNLLENIYGNSLEASGWGGNGVTEYAENIIIDRTTIRRGNNCAGDDTNPNIAFCGAGNGGSALKLLFTHRVYFKNFVAYDNLGAGIWFDTVNGDNAVVESSSFSNHGNINYPDWGLNGNAAWGGAGLWYENSSGPFRVESNFFHNNSGDGIAINEGNYVNLVGNTFAGNSSAVALRAIFCRQVQLDHISGRGNTFVNLINGYAAGGGEWRNSVSGKCDSRGKPVPPIVPFNVDGYHFSFGPDTFQQVGDWVNMFNNDCNTSKTCESRFSTHKSPVLLAAAVTQQSLQQVVKNAGRAQVGSKPMLNLNVCLDPTSAKTTYISCEREPLTINYAVSAAGAGKVAKIPVFGRSRFFTSLDGSTSQVQIHDLQGRYLLLTLATSKDVAKVRALIPNTSVQMKQPVYLPVKMTYISQYNLHGVFVNQ